MFSLFDFFVEAFLVVEAPGQLPSCPPSKKIRPCPLWGPWDASPPTLDIMGTRCIWPSNLCNWLSLFFAGHYAKFTDLLAKCLREKETRVRKEIGETWVDQ